MRVLVIGAGGMLGAKLVARLARDGAVGGRAITGLVRQDAMACPPAPEAAFPVETLTGDIADPAARGAMLAGRPDLVFHLAAIVSGEAERDFDKGYRINLDATRGLLEDIRKAEGWCPRLVFTSSIAVFGRPFPAVIPDDFAPAPLTSYGAQKAISELLIADYSRRGFVEGLSVRMPTLVVRPGKANLAASGFFSNILREPLAGLPAVLPVPDTVRHWFASPRAAVGYLIHAAGLDFADLGGPPTLTLPGLSATVAEEIEALRAVAGSEAVALIRREPDETIARIVGGWPEAFEAARARALGFMPDADFAAILRAYIEDEGNAIRRD